MAKVVCVLEPSRHCLINFEMILLRSQSTSTDNWPMIVRIMFREGRYWFCSVDQLSWLVCVCPWQRFSDGKGVWVCATQWLLRKSSEFSWKFDFDDSSSWHHLHSHQSICCLSFVCCAFAETAWQTRWKYLMRSIYRHTLWHTPDPRVC